MLKKAIENKLTNRQNLNITQQKESVAIERVGVQGDNLIEIVPNYITKTNEKVIQGANNQYICLTTDRPGELGSGRGHETGAGTIDVVVGRVSRDVKNFNETKKEDLFVDPNFSADASRIYISQKTDVDRNFNLATGLVGDSKAKAAIALKSDAIRLIGREGIKLVTKTDDQNSQGAQIRSVPAIEFIAGNDDSDMQSVVKGADLRKALAEIISRIDELNSVLDQFMTYQMELNTVIQNHEHPDPTLILLGAMSQNNPLAINGGKTPFSPELLAVGQKVNALQQIAKKDGIMNKLKTEVNKKNITEVYGAMNPESKRVKTN